MLIVDMPMPEDCVYCPMSHWNKLDEFTGCEVAAGKLFAATRDKEYANSIGRPDWCPIKGVLPEEHGDLIDRDVAFDYINRLICDGCNAETEADCEACIKKGIDEVLYFVKPTIVAERKNDEQIHYECEREFLNLICDAQTVDAVPVVHGEWVEKWRFKPNGNPYHKVGDMECSVCHSDMLGRYYSRYCPHCGARMKGEQNGNKSDH